VPKLNFDLVGLPTTFNKVGDGPAMIHRRIMEAMVSGILDWCVCSEAERHKDLEAILACGNHKSATILNAERLQQMTLSRDGPLATSESHANDTQPPAMPPTHQEEDDDLRTFDRTILSIHELTRVRRRITTN
jgi:hypothetical protein